MGNRFQNMPGYYNLILAHGVIAAIVFLLIVPTAILVNQFYWVRYRAIRIHIWLQVLALLLTTVLFILGFMAVGPSRSLTNPHHAMGVAIYVLILVQFIGGWWVHSRERKKRPSNLTFKAFVSIVSCKTVARSLTRADPQTTRESCRTPGLHPDRLGPHTLWLALLSLHPLLPPRRSASPGLADSLLPKGAQVRTRLR